MSQQSAISQKLQLYARQLRQNKQLIGKGSHNTLNLLRFNRRVNIILTSQANHIKISSSEIRPMKLVDTPATGITIVEAQRLKKIRKTGVEKLAGKKTQTPKAAIATKVRAKKINK